MRKPLAVASSLFVPVCSAGLCGQDAARPVGGAAEAPVELGAVDFARDLDLVLGRRPGKPVFLLFQEIPG